MPAVETRAPGAFARRHIGPSPEDQARMLASIGVPSLDALIDEVVPSRIRLRRPLDVPGPEEEHQFLTRLAQLAARNRVFRSYIGLGYHDTVTPSVILRMVMENPGWYTPYTPYQAEIAQGRLESLINFQTVVSDLTGMDIANASLLDEATAAAEAMALLHRVQTPAKGAAPRRRFLVSDRTFPQTIDVLRGAGRAAWHRHPARAARRAALRRRDVRRCWRSTRTNAAGWWTCGRSSSGRTRPASASPSPPTCWRWCC